MNENQVKAKERFIEIIILTTAILVIASEVKGEAINVIFFFIPFLIVSMLYYFFISHFYLIETGKSFLKQLLFFIDLNMVAALFSAIVVVVSGEIYSSWIYFAYYMLLYIVLILVLFPENLGYSWS